MRSILGILSLSKNYSFEICNLEVNFNLKKIINSICFSIKLNIVKTIEFILLALLKVNYANENKS